MTRILANSVKGINSPLLENLQSDLLQSSEPDLEPFSPINKVSSGNANFENMVDVGPSKKDPQFNNFQQPNPSFGMDPLIMDIEHGNANNELALVATNPLLDHARLASSWKLCSYWIALFVECIRN